MLSISHTLLWYKRPEVRSAMVDGARNKEIGVRYGDGFGKRPDSLEYEQEILEAVQRGATSFHASEELWSNPKAIETGMNKERTNELRTGWDLILDVDFTDFTATKLITNALCQALEGHGVRHYCVKFSGNKGFHIGIPWEAFPNEDGKSATLFPDAARAIADYLVEVIDGPKNNFALSEQIVKVLPKEMVDENVKYVCGDCGDEKKENRFNKYFVCPRCQHRETVPFDAAEHFICPKCRSFMDYVPDTNKETDKCTRCNKVTETRRAFDLKIDTQLVSSRHLYRLEYSLHEKSGLVSLPIPNKHVMQFNRDEAKPENVKSCPPFWNRTVRGEGAKLFHEAQKELAKKTSERAPPKEVVWDGDAAPEEVFPPTIKKMLLGMKDGKKRSLFILTNFLRSIGWNYDMVEVRLREWNEKNDPPLREQEMVSHLRYHKQRNATVLPPNFDNDVYKDLGVLVHDELSANVKNPVQYVKLRLRQAGDPKKSTKTRPAPQ